MLAVQMHHTEQLFFTLPISSLFKSCLIPLRPEKFPSPHILFLDCSADAVVDSALRQPTPANPGGLFLTAPRLGQKQHRQRFVNIVV